MTTNGSLKSCHHHYEKQPAKKGYESWIWYYKLTTWLAIFIHTV